MSAADRMLYVYAVRFPCLDTYVRAQHGCLSPGPESQEKQQPFIRIHSRHASPD